MSQQSRNVKNFPDAPGKTIEDDSEVYEKVDSGFISEDITSENTDSGIIEDKISSRKSIVEEYEDEQEIQTDSMIIDSGVCLSEKFSNISISKEEDLNEKTQSPVELDNIKLKNDFPLFFYEADEDGDT